MTKIKHLILFFCLAGCFAACKNDNSPVDNVSVEEQLKIDTTAIRAFVVKNNIPAIKDPSGVFYQIIQPGTGTVKYSKSTQVSVDYEGRYLNGSVFDSSKGQLITLTLGQVINGWFIGIPYIQPGGKIRLIIPSGQAYGKQGQGPIAPNTVLDFTVSLSAAQ